MKHFKEIVVILTFSILLISCEDFFEKPVDIVVEEHESKLAATAVLGFDRDYENTVLVSRSKGVFERSNESQLLNNATVTLIGNGEEIVFDSNLVEDGIYNSSMINFIPDNEYTMTVSSPDHETIFANQIYPEKPQILEASINSKTFKLSLVDNLNKKNYYLLNLYAETLDGSSAQQVYLEPFGSLTARSSYCYNCVNFTDETFNGKEFEIVVNHYINNVEENQRYRVELYNVTEDFFRYDTSLLNSENAEGNPFVEPVILHRNFENGYGIFSLMNKAEYIFQLN